MAFGDQRVQLWTILDIVVSVLPLGRFLASMFSIFSCCPPFSIDTIIIKAYNNIQRHGHNTIGLMGQKSLVSKGLIQNIMVSKLNTFQDF